ncbi:Fasciclin-like arabinogalactan protein 9 [Sesamum alatum]|uniref:Fasciclin-like arabinogalactan protein 9 n=1 Tax=Sesamum alatum TaxID=300844 RepID=A0AAE1YZE2_9LAMI|nr:Fasciclin-like arabinogalactan protein 9 [Sesamum alatum]
MAAPPCSSLILLPLTTLLSALLLLPAARAQSAPAPAPSGPINITAILEKAGQYTTFIRFLNETQAGNQINNQVNNSHDGMTVFAPTDNAFNNLPSGTLNNLSDQQHVQLVLYHICPKFYSLESLLSVSNPVRTQASGQDGGVFGLNFTGQGNQVNVSTGIVEVPLYNALRKDFPLAVYQVDKVLLPEEFYKAKAPAASPPAADGSGSPAGDGGAKAPSTGNPGNGSGRMSVGLGLVSGIWLLCMALLS